MGLSRTQLEFLADDARAAMLAPWRNDKAYVAVPSYAVGTDGIIYRSLQANGVDDDGNNVGVGAQNPVGDATSTWTDLISDEQIQDIIGGTFTGNAETNITSTYNDTTGKIDLTVPSASETSPGAIRKATNIEAITGTSTTSATTPAGVSAAINNIPASSETIRGTIEIASTGEAAAGTDNTRAITPLRLQERLDAADSTPTTRTIATTAPLQGGGDLSADRTLTVDAATTSAPGVVQLSTSTTSTSTTLAATASAVRAAALAGSVPNTAGAVNTYTLAINTGQSRSFGQTQPGTTLRPSNVSGDGGSLVVGTWRCMGNSDSANLRDQTHFG